MADEFQATSAICGSGGGAWWNSPRSVMSPSDNFLSPCFRAAITSDEFGCQENNIKSRNTCTDNNIIFGQPEADTDSGGSTVTIDSTMQIMGLGFASNSSSDWKHTILQEDLNSSLLRSSQDHGPGFLSTTTSPYLLNPACSSSSSISYSSSLLRTFYDPEPNPYSFVSTTSCSINDPRVSWANNNTTNPHHQAAYGLINNFSNNINSRPLSKTTQNSFATTPQIISTRVEDKAKNQKTRGQSESLKRAKYNEPASKKQRVSTPSPLPTFKVRKENLRDQITSLQQLVSPFGKTDTASVLQEAIEYIKFLHDQVTVLSTPYMKQGAPIHQQQQDGNENQELRAHGLCLVPISSTFPVANETTADFWTPTFGGNNFR
ncbi:Transcription factor bHLH112 [Raphanus sativus]|uniref:Transcription factor bHLH112 isoform X1 n=1 Tax=Raphanus sativus TaxID=3726 RepID=A0A6J0JE96_RAPSA|nr:transcription factor bHLH112 isoform X1 [Raphanus sativus]KAJ4887305.1 Transcription factor bHLH112 [Raphanus sativus]